MKHNLPTMKLSFVRAVYLLATHIYYNDCKFTVRVFPSDLGDSNWHITFKVDTFYECSNSIDLSCYMLPETNSKSNPDVILCPSLAWYLSS